MKARIQKLSAVKNPKVETASRKEIIPGEWPSHNKSLFVEYTVEGEIPHMPEVGKCVWMHRDIRNGVRVEGVFNTSSVTKVEDGKFHTQNSVYSIEVL